MPLPTGDLIAWITSLGWDANQETGCPLYGGPYIPPEPDRLVILTPVGGPGYLNEGATDSGGFQARVRGPQSGDASPFGQAAAEKDAYRLDQLIFAAQFPVVLPSGQVLVKVYRFAGVPSPLTGTPDDGDRWEYTCEYLYEVST